MQFQYPSVHIKDLTLSEEHEEAMIYGHTSGSHEVIASNMHEAPTMAQKTPHLAVVLMLPQFTARGHGEVTGDLVRRGAKEEERISHPLSFCLRPWLNMRRLLVFTGTAASGDGGMASRGFLRKEGRSTIKELSHRGKCNANCCTVRTGLPIWSVAC